MPASSPQARRIGVHDLWSTRGGSGAAGSATSSSSTNASINVARSTRSFLVRLSIFTRAVSALMVLLYVVDWLPMWDLRALGALTPSKLTLSTMHLTNTFPLLHMNLFHLVSNVAAVMPLLDRFEHDHGTLTTIALFFGPFSTLPALMYVAFERIFGLDTPIIGASIWVFLLLGVEAIRTYRTHPHFVVAGVPVPTWTTPLFFVFVVAALVPHTSMPGHLFGLLVGYLCGLGYLKFLSPPESVLRFVETRLNLLVRVPHYVSVDQKTYGRFGVLPSVNNNVGVVGGPAGASQAIGLVGSTQRLGP